MDKFLFVQFSDIHFGQGKADGSVDWHHDVRERVLEDLKVMSNKLGRAAYGVMVTGDIAHATKPGEYSDANRFLQSVAANVGCAPSEMYIVPGNHDVDRTVNVGVDDLVHQQLRMLDINSIEARLQTYSRNPLDAHPLYQKLRPYREFARSFECDFSESGKPFWMHDLTFDGIGVVRLVGLCSVQVCDHLDNKGMMILGSKQYLLPVEEGVEYVVLMHHPLEWFKDRAEIEQKFNNRVRVLICGHEHRAQICSTRFETDCEQLVLDSGALNPPVNDNYAFTYNWLDFYVSEDAGRQFLSIKVYPRIWVPARDKFLADHSRMELDDQEGKQFMVPAPRFKKDDRTVRSQLGAAVVENDQRAEANQAQCSGVHLSSSGNKDDKAFKRLKYLFWQLPWQQRLRILVGRGLIDHAAQKEMPHDFELWALNNARQNGQLGDIWDAVASHHPTVKDEVNPFKETLKTADV